MRSRVRTSIDAGDGAKENVRSPPRRVGAAGREQVHGPEAQAGARDRHRPMPDITLTFGTEVTDVKRIKINRLE